MQTITTPELQKQLTAIRPGLTYPGQVEISETIDGEPFKIKFLLQSYYVGMYCAMYVNDDSMPHQTSDCDNKTFVAKLKKDILKADKRGATILIQGLRSVKKEP